MLQSLSQMHQQSLMANYQRGLHSGIPSMKLHEIGFKQFSENTEDGILLYIFSRIGTTNRVSVEIGCGYGAECNTANLILNHNWHGLLVDRSEERIKFAKQYYREKLNMGESSPVVRKARITKQNANQVLKDAGFEGEIDLLSIDIDGIDYWIWKEIEIIKPRVVVVEVQCIWGSKTSVTVPYSDDFEAEFIDGFGVYSGASLPAFNKLAIEKGFRFAGIESKGFNAFFVKNDIGRDLLPEEDISVIDGLQFVKWAKNKFLEPVRHKKWIEV